MTDHELQLKAVHLRKIVFAYVVVLLALTIEARAQISSNRPSLPLEKFAFSHPMTVINQVEKAVVKKRIADKTEPQFSAFQKLVKDAEEAQRFKANPPVAIDMDAYDKDTTQNTELRPWLWRNCHAAYASALAYAYTGEKKYAEKAVEILNDWAVKNTTFKGNDSGLQLGSWFTPMLYAADLLHDYPGWRADQRARFISWWRAKCLPSVHRAMQIRVNNWKDAGLLGVMAAAVVFEDIALLQDALQTLDGYYFSPPPATGPKNRRIRKIEKDQHGDYLIAEVTRNEGRSGITYTAYALTTMVQALEIARYAGHDFWHRKTDQGATLQGVIENYFLWDVQKKAFPWNANPDGTLKRKNSYEIANNHFKLMPEIGAWLKANRPVNGEQGDEYVTLNKGELSVSDKP